MYVYNSLYGWISKEIQDRAGQMKNGMEYGVIIFYKLNDEAKKNVKKIHFPGFFLTWSWAMYGNFRAKFLYVNSLKWKN